jgi:excisionase family DNA binding protein
MTTLPASHETAPGRTRKLLTAEAVAERLDVPKSTVYEAARQNRIGGVVRLGRVLRFDPEKFEHWLESGGQALPGGWRQEEAA